MTHSTSHSLCSPSPALATNTCQPILLRCAQHEIRSEAILLLQHEPIRQDLHKLNQYYNFANLQSKPKRELLYSWFKNHLSILIDWHEHLEEQMWNILRQKQQISELKGIVEGKEHFDLEKALQELTSHLEELSQKDVITESDLKVSKIKDIQSLLIDHLFEQEDQLLPVLKSKLTQQDVFEMLESIFTKSNLPHINSLFPWIINGCQKWASQSIQKYFQELIESNENQQMKQWVDDYNNNQKQYNQILNDTDFINPDQEGINLLAKQNDPQLRKLSAQVDEIDIEMQKDETGVVLEQILLIYGFLNQARQRDLLEVDRQKFRQIIQDTSKINMQPISFFFQNLSLKLQMVVILNILKQYKQPTTQTDDEGIFAQSITDLDKYINQTQQPKIYMILEQINKTNQEKLSQASKKRIKSIVTKFKKLEAVTCFQKFNQALDKAENFRVEGVDDTFYGIFLALYLIGLVKDVDVLMRIGSGLVSLYLGIVNFKCVKARCLDFVHMFCSFKFLKGFLTSFCSWEGIKTHDYKKFIEDYAFIGMDVTFALKAFGAVNDEVVIISGVITQSMMVMSALIEIVQRIMLKNELLKHKKDLQSIQKQQEQLNQEVQAISLNQKDMQQLDLYLSEQIKVQKKEFVILPLFALFEFGLVFFGLVALLSIDLKSQAIEFAGPFLDAVCVLITQITKRIVERKLKDEEIDNYNNTHFAIAIDNLNQQKKKKN